MAEIGIFHGEAILLRGKGQREMACFAIAYDECQTENILINKAVRKNLSVNIGDIVR